MPPDSRVLSHWIALNIIGNEITGFEPFPASIRDDVAAVMVADQDRLGWPDLESAQATLDDFEWTETP